MKIVRCCGYGCGSKYLAPDAHYSRELHATVMEVPDDSVGPWYCSLTCYHVTEKVPIRTETKNEKIAS